MLQCRHRSLLSTLVVLLGCGAATAPVPGGGLNPAGADPVPPPVDLSLSWTASTPAAEGFDATALEAVFDAASTEVPNIRALVAVRNGRLVQERYYGGAHADSALDLRSVTKTITALLVGIVSGRDQLSIDDRMVDWIDDEALRPEHDAIRVRHLLKMTSGMRWTDAGDFNPWVLSGRPVGYVLDQPVVAAPDQQFMYNTGGSHLLSVIIGAAAGKSTFDLAQEALFGPLGFENHRWPVAQDGVVSGGAGLSLRPRDVAKVGQLLLQGGTSGEEEIVSRAWVASQVDRLVGLGDIGAVLDDAGYGYQTWSDRSGGGVGVPAFVMWGYGGQFVWVVPDRQLVVVAATHWRGTNDNDFQQAGAVADRLVRRVVAAALPVTG